MSDLHFDRADDGARSPAPSAGQTVNVAQDGDLTSPETADTSASLPDEPTSRSNSHWLSFILTAVAVVVVDQISKRYIDANLAVGESWPDASWPIRIMHVKNTGAAFSMLQNQTLFLTVMSVVGLGAILLYFLFRPSDHPLLRFALALQLGGAIGNLIDRALLGEVTDFFKFPRFAVFNVADSAISIGVATVVIFLLFANDKPKKSPDET
ncbi:MAG: signal peptidase II [Dehalococcoidia bacterium]